MSDSDYRKELRRQHKSAGLCAMCDKSAQDGKSLCTYHLEKQNLKAIQRRIRRLNSNMCIMCNNAPIIVGKTKCALCVQKDKDRYRLTSSKIRERVRINGNTRYALLRTAAYNAYDHKCACCSETEEAFFTFDHINNDGREHRDALGTKGGLPFLKWLSANNFPDTIQLLCANCHLAKTRLGACIHQLEISDNMQAETITSTTPSEVINASSLS